jgi:hypothetical protein
VKSCNSASNINSGWISAIIQHSFENCSDVLVELDGYDFNCRLAQTKPLDCRLSIIRTCFHIVGDIPIFSIIFPLYLYDIFLLESQLDAFFTVLPHRNNSVVHVNVESAASVELAKHGEAVGF